MLSCLLAAEEEKDVDDWDVDMSVYYDADGGDKDARDMVTMRREARRRTGKPFSHDDDTFASAIGNFERHSKVPSFVLFVHLSSVSETSLKSLVDVLTD